MRTGMSKAIMLAAMAGAALSGVGKAASRAGESIREMLIPHQEPRLHYDKTTWTANGRPVSGAAGIKRASAKKRNMRARSKK